MLIVSLITKIIVFVEIPLAEKVTFLLTTLLSDVAILSSDSERKEIICMQLDLLQRVGESINEAINSQVQDPHKKEHVVDVLGPILLGVARAFGRYGETEEKTIPLFTLIYPKPKAPVILKRYEKGTVKSIPNFRSVIPRSLSTSFGVPIYNEPHPEQVNW